MYGRTYIENNIAMDAYRKRYSLISIRPIYRCMDIHLKKLNDIKKTVTIKKNDDVKKVEETL